MFFKGSARRVARPYTDALRSIDQESNKSLTLYVFLRESYIEWTHQQRAEHLSLILHRTSNMRAQGDYSSSR
mgnify:CR=1 FL=1